MSTEALIQPPPAYNRNGGLTLVPMPGSGFLAEEVKNLIETKKKDTSTPVDIVSPVLGFRSNGEPHVQLGKKHIGGHDCMVLANGPGTYEMLGRLLMVLGYLKGRRAGRISLVTGYMPLGRTDKDEGVLEFALASHVIRLILSAAYGKLDRIIVPDLHSPQVVMAAELGTITEVTLARRVLQRAVEDARREYPDKPVCILFPDDGASKRYSEPFKEVSNRLGEIIPGICGVKRRWDSNKSELLGMVGDTSALKGAVVITIDDEIATGGTNINVAKEVMNKYGAFAFRAAAIHGVLCEHAPRRFADPGCPVQRIYITDTIPPANRPELDPIRKLLTVIPWASDLANMIYHHHWDEEVRELR